jgi:hypothetical protein
MFHPRFFIFKAERRGGQDDAPLLGSALAGARRREPMSRA